MLYSSYVCWITIIYIACDSRPFRSFLVFWSSTSSAATRYGLQTTEPKVPICIMCCRHARARILTTDARMSSA